jgi:MFS family permease
MPEAGAGDVDPRGRLARLDPMWIAVVALGISQITAWGTSYYALGVLAKPIADDTGWSRSLVFSGFTVGLLVMGIVSARAGRAIDQYGAQRVMALGTVVSTCGLYLLSQVESEASYLAVWALIGLGMRLTLYDAAFAALVQVTPTRGRRAISYLTLFGAFASSIFWVIGHFLNDALGWRDTVVVFALINLAVCLPLHWFGLARREPAQDQAATRETAATTAVAPPLEGRMRSMAIGLFMLIMSLSAFVFGVVTVQLVPMLEAAGLAAGVAVWVASMKGVAQFAGRLIEITLGANLRAITVARIALGILPIALLLLLSDGNFHAIVAFTLLLGISQGVVTIVRGAVPLALFGATGYGAVLGLIATPILVVNAVAPTAFAWIVERWGWFNAEVVLLMSALASYIAMEAMARWVDRHRKLPRDQ